MKYKMLFVN